VAAVAAGRRPADLFAGGHDDDVADPYGRALEHYRRTAAELDTLTSALASLARP
jgi:hypothetical protein